MARSAPEVGVWYENLQTGEIFEVVAVDDHALTIETQCRDGTLGEYDFDSWRELTLVRAGEPEDWRDAYELTAEDRDDADTPLHPDAWNDPLDRIEPDVIYGLFDTDDPYT